MILTFIEMTSVFDNESYLQDFSEEDPKTWKDVDPKATTMAEVYKVKYHLHLLRGTFFQWMLFRNLALTRTPLTLWDTRWLCSGRKLL